jgi:hypothetical protein
VGIIRNDLTGTAVATIVAGMAAQLYAVYYLTKAVRRGVVSLRPQMAVNASMAAVYFVASLWLLFSNYDQATWNTVMIGVSLVVWIVAWAGPAKWSIDQQEAWERKHSDGA